MFGSATTGLVLGVPIISASTKPERYRMKRLTEWINLIAAVLRLITVIIRTGWL
ncbi:hypothetical protein HBO07_19535 [Pseudomonas proteolytica]|uniref:hypothetical protein n=1 Tax=Pseudomonas proteolytica TaxID=219574 RepID=UPI001474DD71|nr:hypothetical protein [Pseudomonas proteolytica]NMZ13477.1 hypothetical protein [Pseudomonas proteolytica]